MLVKSGPHDGAVRNRAIDFLTRYRLEARAQEVLEEAAAADPEEDVPVLAQFLLRRHRFLAARVALEAWLSPDSVRYTKAAELFKEAGYPMEAEALLRLALRFDAQYRTAVEALLELLIARNDLAGARKWIEATYASATDLEWRKDLDQRLFNLLSAADGPVAINSMSAPPVARNSEINGFIKTLERTAQQTNQSTDYLRLAVWQDWAHDGEASIEAAQRAVDLDSSNTAAREHLLDLALKSRNLNVAQAQLRELAGKIPRRRRSMLESWQISSSILDRFKTRWFACKG